MPKSPEILISPAFAASGVKVALGCLTARVSVREDDPDTTAALSQLSAELAAEIGERPVGELPVIARLRDSRASEGFDYETRREIFLAEGQNMAIDFKADAGGFIFR